MGVKTDVQVNVPEEVPFSDVELTALVGNLMENAVDALEQVSKVGTPADSLSLRVHGTWSAGMPLVLTIDNTCVAPPERMADGTLASSKHGGAGIGCESVRSIAEFHGGEARFEYEDKVFRASVILPEP